MDTAGYRRQRFTSVESYINMLLAYGVVNLVIFTVDRQRQYFHGLYFTRNPLRLVLIKLEGVRICHYRDQLKNLANYIIWKT